MAVAPRTEGNRREPLLRAAARLFRDRGYRGTTIRDIAGAVGMRSGSPHYHFATKHEMLRAVILEGMRAALAELEAIEARGLPPREALNALVRAHLGVIHDKGRDFVPVMLSEFRELEPATRREIIALRDRYERIWRRALERLRAEGQVRRADRYARLFVLGALNWTSRWFRPGGALSLEQLAETFTDYVCGGRR
jgi:AcrR family transcriptional regulator